MNQGPLGRTDQTIPGLWRYYEEHATQARQHENLRASVTSILSAIAAAVISLAGIGGLGKADIPAGIAVVVLGFLGVALSVKHYERNRFHTRIMGAIRTEITRLNHDETAVPLSTEEIRSKAEAKHSSSFTVWRTTKPSASEPRPAPKSPWVRVHLHILWLGLPAAVGIVGILVIALAIVGVAPTK